MQRWWYSDDKANCKDNIPKSKRSPSKKSELLKNWKFSVLANVDLNLHDRIAVTGDCDELGNWEVDNCILLNHNEGEYYSAFLNQNLNYLCIIGLFTLKICL